MHTMSAVFWTCDILCKTPTHSTAQPSLSAKHQHCCKITTNHHNAAGSKPDFLFRKCGSFETARCDLKSRGVGRKGGQTVQGVAHNGQHGRDASPHPDQQHLPELGVLLCGGPERTIDPETGCLQQEV